MNKKETIAKCWVLYLANAVLIELIFIIFFRLAIYNDLLDNAGDLGEMIPDTVSTTVSLVFYGIFFFFVIMFALVFFTLFKSDQEGGDISYGGGARAGSGGTGAGSGGVLLIGMIIFLPAYLISRRRVQNATADFVDPQETPNPTVVEKKPF